MDNETREMLLSILALLRETTTQAFEAREAVDRVLHATQSAVPGFNQWYSGPGNFLASQHIVHEGSELVKKIDELVQRIEQSGKHRKKKIPTT